MGFLQPWLLIALPLAIIPIAIHLVNQWRYHNKPWAAMMFLLRAKTMHQGFDRLRQWAILAMRVAAIIGLIIAASRPISSGFVAWLSGGNVDTLMVLLDCSPSMLATGPNNELSKHQTAIEQLRKSLPIFNASKWVLLDSSTLQTTEFLTSDALLNSVLLRVSDSACDWPAMMDSAIDYLTREKPSQAHLWVVSDLQASNFDQNSPRWDSIEKRLSVLSRTTRLTSIEYPDSPVTNRAIRVIDARWELSNTGESRSSGTIFNLLLSFSVASSSFDKDEFQNVSQSIPVTISWRGNETQIIVELKAGRAEIKDYLVGTDLIENLKSSDSNNELGQGRSIQVASNQTWGRLQLPQDGNLADNEDFFAADIPTVAKTQIFTERLANVLPIKLAAESPADTTVRSQVDLISPNDFQDQPLDDTAFLVWQSQLPTESSLQALEDFASAGGSVWIFPPEQTVAPNLDESKLRSDFALGDAPKNDLQKDMLMHLQWGPWQKLSEPISPTSWQSDRGLLRATQSGAALGVGDIRVSQLASIFDNSESNQFDPIASFADGQPLIVGWKTLPNELMIWTTLLSDEYSNLGYSANESTAVSLGIGVANSETLIAPISVEPSVVLYVAVQRAIEFGRRRLRSVVNIPATSGHGSFAMRTVNFDSSKLPKSEEWEPLLTTNRFVSSQVESHAGVFRAGKKLVAIQRPEIEDDSRTLSQEEWDRLFKGIPIKRLSEQTGSRNDLQSETWRGFMVLLIVALLVEAVLSLPKRSPPQVGPSKK